MMMMMKQQQQQLRKQRQRRRPFGAAAVVVTAIMVAFPLCIIQSLLTLSTRVHMHSTVAVAFASPLSYSTTQRRRSWRRQRPNHQYYHRRLQQQYNNNNNNREQVRRYVRAIRNNNDNNDYSSHFLDGDEWMHDARSRIYQVNSNNHNNYNIQQQQGRLPRRVVSLTSRLIWTNVLMYGLQMGWPSVTTWGIKLSGPIRAGQQLHRIFTPMFLHGSFAHLCMNMVSLSRVGPDVERLFGPGRWWALYAASGVAGNVASALYSPNPSLGASGAVFGLMGAYFTFLNRNAWLLGSSGERMTAAMGQTMLFNVVTGFMLPSIDHWAHLGGALGGAVMAYYFGPRLYLCEYNPNNKSSSTRVDTEDKEDDDYNYDYDYRPSQSRRLIIDRPVARLPRNIEGIPERIYQRWQHTLTLLQTRQLPILQQLHRRPYLLRQQHKNKIIENGGEQQEPPQDMPPTMMNNNNDDAKPWQRSTSAPRKHSRHRIIPNRSIKPRKT